MTHRTLPIVLLLALGLFSGACGQEDRPRISIDFGAHPEEFSGAGVVIDGLLVGTLDSAEGSTQASFSVEPGLHLISLRHPRLRSVTRSVATLPAGQLLCLKANVEENWEEGRLHPYIVLDG